jgi:hypothetical protein
MKSGIPDPADMPDQEYSIGRTRPTTVKDAKKFRPSRVFFALQQKCWRQPWLS